MTKLTRLFEPIRLGSLELPNRIIWPPLTTFHDTNYDLKGEERSAYFYGEMAKGGAGLIIIGALQALYPGRRDPDRVAINSDSWLPHLRLWTKTVHDNGGRAAAQLGVWSYWARGGEGTTAEDVSPSGVVTVEKEAVPQDPRYARYAFPPESRPLTVEEIHVIEEQVGDAAVRAVEAGFDAIELPTVAGNLIDRFITPYTNRRTDEYGGSLENRLRMLLETIAVVKKRVGDDFPLICRVSGSDLLPWGLTLEDVKEYVPMIERAGVHALNVFAGWYESREPKYDMSVPRGAFVYLAEGIKQVVNIPICTNMRINDPVLAEQIIAEGRADLVAMGRALIADPELPNKAREGRVEDIRLCVACMECGEDIVVKDPLFCSVNARAGKERVYPITPAQKPGRVFVIGGGPAGMEAARVAALRGHKVTLFEKRDKLGGQLLYAVLPPHKEEWNTLISYLSTQMRKLNIEVRLNEEATAGVVAEGRPDAAILATGAVPVIPDIPGVEGGNVVVALDVLVGTKEVGPGVVIIGGGLIGLETADFLIQRGKRVTVLEMLPTLGADMGMSSRMGVLGRLEKAGVRMETGAAVEEITGRGVRVTHRGGPEFFEAGSVVIAAGMKCVDHLARELKGRVPSLYQVGACVEPRRVRQAIWEGFEAGLKV